MNPDPLSEVVALSRTLGEPDRDLAILAEGNTSIRSGQGRMFVKASGARLRTADSADFVELYTAPLLDLLGGNDSRDEDVAAVMRASQVDDQAPRASMEALLHAVCQAEAHTPVVAHTHPIAVNALLCSDQAPALVAGHLFPDQVVVLGRRNLLVDYADPGLALARLVRRQLLAHIETHGEPPKVVFLSGHGIFALADNTSQALAITEMTVKTARILSGALAAGRPRYLPDAEADRIDTRPDERFRRQRLSAQPQGAR